MDGPAIYVLIETSCSVGWRGFDGRLTFPRTFHDSTTPPHGLRLLAWRLARPPAVAREPINTNQHTRKRRFLLTSEAAADVTGPFPFLPPPSLGSGSHGCSTVPSLQQKLFVTGVNTKIGMKGSRWAGVDVRNASRRVCVCCCCCWPSHLAGWDSPCMVAIPARGQQNNDNIFSLSSSAPEILVVRDRFGCPVSRQSVHSSHPD